MHRLADEPPERPSLFADPLALHAFAAADSEGRGGYGTVARPWLAGLAEVLASGCAGARLRLGPEASFELGRGELASLTAALALSRIDAGHTLHVVARGRAVHYRTGGRGEAFAVAWSRSDDAVASAAADERAVELSAVAIDARSLLRGLLAAGAARLLVDPGLPGELALERDVMEVLLAAWSDPEHELLAPRDEPPGEPAGEPASPDAAQAVAPEPPRPPRERPGRSDAEAVARVAELRALLAGRGRGSWVVLDLLADDLDLWVPVVRGSDGERWPASVRRREASGGERSVAPMYSSERAARAALARAGKPDAPLAPLAGVEAFRWVWSSPADVAEVCIDPDDPAGPLTVSQKDVLHMLFPAILPVRDLEQVPDVPLERLHGLPRVHGLRPEVLRVLARGWQRLLAPPLDGSQAPVSLGDRTYLPLFSSAERFHHFARHSWGRIPTPQVAGRTPPFLRLMRLASRCDGAVIDPGFDHALTLEQTELFFLHLWAEKGRQPDGAAVAKTLASLQAGDYTLDQLTAGRVAAEWPLFLAARVEGPSRELVAVPRTGELALFSSERALADFERIHRASGVFGGRLQPVHLLPRFGASYFHTACERYSGARIDSGSIANGEGAVLDGKGLDGALERLHRRLRPRV